MRTQHKEEQVSAPYTFEEVPTTLSSGEVDDGRIGRLASPLLKQKSEASVTLTGVCHSQRELHVTLTTPKHREACCKTLTQAEIEQGPTLFTGNTAFEL